MSQVVSGGGGEMVGPIAVISCSFILGNRDGLSDKKVFEQRPEGSEGANCGCLREQFQAEENS